MKTEAAVSPVIGVILMVAITVILSAIIAAFVLGMAGNMPKESKLVGMNIHQPDQGSIVVTYMGGQGSGFFMGANVSINEVRNVTAPILPVVGSSIRYYGDFGSRDHVVITGHFSDGSETVLIDTYL
jgi:flagellin-like protein